MAVDGVAKHVWMTREQKLAFQKERRTGKAAPEAAETTATA